MEEAAQTPSAAPAAVMIRYYTCRVRYLVDNSRGIAPVRNNSSEPLDTVVDRGDSRLDVASALATVDPDLIAGQRPFVSPIPFRFGVRRRVGHQVAYSAATSERRLVQRRENPREWW